MVTRISDPVLAAASSQQRREAAGAACSRQRLGQWGHAALPDKWREKHFVLKFRETSALYQFDLEVNLTFLFVLIQHSVAEFCISCSQTADDLLFLHYYSWFWQPASPGAEEECWWCVCGGCTAGAWLVTDLERKGVELSVWFQGRWKCIQPVMHSLCTLLWESLFTRGFNPKMSNYWTAEEQVNCPAEMGAGEVVKAGRSEVMCSGGEGSLRVGSQRKGHVLGEPLVAYEECVCSERLSEEKGWKEGCQRMC